MRLGTRMEIGKTYRTAEGKRVVVVILHDGLPGYETAEDECGICRYNRTTSNSDLGRMTGTDHDFSDPRNVVAEWTEADDRLEMENAERKACGYPSRNR